MVFIEIGRAGNGWRDEAVAAEYAVGGVDATERIGLILLKADSGNFSNVAGAKHPAAEQWNMIDRFTGELFKNPFFAGHLFLLFIFVRIGQRCSRARFSAAAGSL